ncbi:ATP-binding cassette, subfamily B, multidrug efflux pump [Anaerovirgula multivorans]|uniref:ATP-binding cassette, subfamily B, multidrug efflux pump n=1 Tax=Anaerovirgula multivorans TaxID=312168 RepID=A0A239JYY8_9FIRM|nr:ABC transporter ATP-binding protein [Anaerovirgula multivorans]SNT11000.1 ATP-binding cassette, subfamily B, multidrug efflux pump [Anaerovirgula multivorans]
MRKFGPPKGKETLVQFLLKYKFQFIVSSVAGIFYNTVIVLGPIFLGKLIDAAAGGTTELVLLSALYFVGVTSFFQFARFIKRWYMRDQFNHVACDLRQTLLDRILGYKLPELEKETVGDLMSRTVGDITLVVDTVMSTINEGWDTWLLMLSYFGVLLYMDWKITLLASLLVPGTLLLAHMMRNVLYRYSLSSRQSASIAHTGLQRYLSAISVLRLFGREEAEKSTIMEAYEQQVKWNIKQILLQQSLLPVYALIAGLGVVIVIGMGGENVRTGMWTVGTFNAYMVMFIAFSGRTRVAAKVFNRWHGAKAAWQRIKEKMILDKNEKIADTDTFDLRNTDQLKVSHLDFSYGSKEVLRDICFEVKAGEIVGITGAVGSGKSTLINALLGLYPYEGDILINSRQLSDIADSQRNNMIGYSGHEQFLFSMNIEENIIFGLEYKNPELKDTLTTAALVEDIERFDDGLKTGVGEKGLKVSGGQRQRISMARAIYKKPAILLLDDPFSALDIATEQRVIKRLKEDFKDQIVILSSHRLSAFENVDKIIVLEKGSILEAGTHNQLMSRRGLYYEIYQAQKFMKEGSAHE